jgi:hypothetical protein
MNHNGTRDYGIMQLSMKNPAGVDWNDPATNIDLGTRELAQHLKQTGGDVTGALWRYNGLGAPITQYAVPVYQDYMRLKHAISPQGLPTTSGSEGRRPQPGSAVSTPDPNVRATLLSPTSVHALSRGGQSSYVDQLGYTHIRMPGYEDKIFGPDHQQVDNDAYRHWAKKTILWRDTAGYDASHPTTFGVLGDETTQAAPLLSVLAPRAGSSSVGAYGLVSQPGPPPPIASRAARPLGPAIQSTTTNATVDGGQARIARAVGVLRSIPQYKAQYGNVSHLYTDCGRFVWNVVKVDDPNFPSVFTYNQWKYIKANPQLYTSGNINSASDVQPGDILYRFRGGSHHTAIFGGGNTIYSGSLDGHAPNEERHSPMSFDYYARPIRNSK